MIPNNIVSIIHSNPKKKIRYLSRIPHYFPPIARNAVKKLAFHCRGVIKYHTLARETHEEVNYLPNIKSAEKRVLVGERNNLRNRVVKSGVKTALKKFDAAAATGSADAQELFVKAASAVDKAASKGVIHKNAANRKKAQLAKKIAKA